MQIVCTLFVTLMLTGLVLTGPCNTAQAGTPDAPQQQFSGQAIYHELKSELLGRSFYIFVDLPEGYADSQIIYPTIYLLDGGITFPLLSSYHRYLRFGEETPAAILVGISYGTESFEEGNMRSTDYSAPSIEREFWGGASAFQMVLKNELLPLIERNYRSDPSERIIFGQSMGGQFVLYTALTQPSLFSGHIASNPALHRNLPFFLEWHGEKDMTSSVSKLFVSNGELNDQRYQAPALKWTDYWKRQTLRPWVLETRILPGQTHFSAVPESFRQGLLWLNKEQE